ncbi:MAG: peptidase M16 domain-containing protein [Parcubacteria group bacterium Athens1014_10]|nr:MAG: peptidase M16 domain-containing protein [Parcubacteria group bacterium Athens1014_10]TSD05525.1 MAG: peptidase M16 domain-containing protein [Parcubacteria group bacterium Athens0714_12]
MHKLTTLKNGLKIITSEMPHTSGVSTNIFVGAGSRYETKKESGISHFAEHMFFKGTKKRPSTLEISKIIDGVGGIMNAFTAHDHTCFWNKVPKKYFSLGIDVVSDTFLNSLFKEKEIEKEKGVIMEEINMGKDTPMRHVVDLFYELIFQNTPLGQNIIGTKKSVSAMKREDFMVYLKSLYQPQNIAISVAGDIKHSKIVEEIKKRFDKIEKRETRKYQSVIDEQNKPAVLINFKDTNQSHLILGFKALSKYDPQKPVLDMINMILSGGMSSRLFIDIRVKKGLAYYVRAYEHNFMDIGCFYVHAGLNSEKIEEAIKLIIKEFKELKEKKVSLKELKKAKEYLKGNLLLDMDDTEEVSSWFGTQALFEKKIKTPEEKIKEIEKVTAEQIQKLSQKLFIQNKMNLALIGPFKDEKPFLKLLKI